MPEDYTGPTPIARYGKILAKRDDMFCIAGIRGGKVRTCWHLATQHRLVAPAENHGLITASARKSPQMQIVARLAARLGIPARLHTATGPMTDEMRDASLQGGELIQHRPGYNSVIVSRADADAAGRAGWTYIPFGMECPAAVRVNRAQVESLAPYKRDIKRIVIVIGSGMTAAGILHGLRDWELDIPVVGIQIGAEPTRRLAKWAPPFWQQQLQIITSRHAYTAAVDAKLGSDILDPHYEAKCMEHTRPGDLLWVVGVRAGLGA